MIEINGKQIMTLQEYKKEHPGFSPLYSEDFRNYLKSFGVTLKEYFDAVDKSFKLHDLVTIEGVFFEVIKVDGDEITIRKY